jgi:hypothetical protein
MPFINPLSYSYISFYEFLKSKLEPHVESEVQRNLISGFVASVISQVNFIYTSVNTVPPDARVCVYDVRLSSFQ